MEKNKRRLAGRLFCLALGAFFILRTAGYIREISGGRESIDRCRKAINGAKPLPAGYLSRLEGRLAELRSLARPEGASQSAVRPNPEDSAGMIRNALRSHAIAVERLRTLSTGGSAVTEFVLSSPPANFLRFLQGAADIPLPLSYIGIKPNAHSSAIDVTVRFSHAQ
jgi:type II secretory pathway component PulM